MSNRLAMSVKTASGTVLSDADLDARADGPSLPGRADRRG